MNEKQLKCLLKVTEKAVRDQAINWQKLQHRYVQCKMQEDQLKQYYQEYICYQKNNENKAQQAKMLSNTHDFMNHLQGMLMSQSMAVQQAEKMKHKGQLEWKKQQAKKKYLNARRWRKWEEEEDASEEEEAQELKNGVKKD